jgi:hypothetical protein
MVTFSPRRRSAERRAKRSAMLVHDNGVQSLERAVSRRFGEWGGAHVELAIYGVEDAGLIARTVDEFCRRHLGSGVHETLFYKSSVGAVTGVTLEDQRRVVVKIYQPDRSLERLLEIVELQRHLARARVLAPDVLAGPAPLASGLGVVEEYIDRGDSADAHDSTVRVALARALHAVVVALAPFVGASRLPPCLLGLPEGVLWPKPHHAMFDFEATLRGAEEIDALAAEARRRMLPVGRLILGHSDWRVEHVRFEDGEPRHAFDWDSLCKEREPALVGAVAHGFCSDWTRPANVQTPTLDEAKGFVFAYEAARGQPFTRAERALCGAAFGYGVVYSARCGHAIGKQERHRPGTFHNLIEVHGRDLLEL